MAIKINRNPENSIGILKNPSKIAQESWKFDEIPRTIPSNVNETPKYLENSMKILKNPSKIVQKSWKFDWNPQESLKKSRQMLMNLQISRKTIENTQKSSRNPENLIEILKNPSKIFQKS